METTVNIQGAVITANGQQQAANGLTTQQRATNTTVNAVCFVLGCIHAGATIIADGALQAETSLKLKHYTKEDGSKLGMEDMMTIIHNRIDATRRIQMRIGQIPKDKPQQPTDQSLDGAFEDDNQ